MNTIQIIALGILLILTVVLQSWGDGVRDSGDKEKEKTLKLFMILVFFIIAYLTPVNFKFTLLLGFSYTGIRTFLFDFVHNAVCKQPWYYSGKFSLTDRVVGKMDKWMIISYRSFALIFAGVMFYLAIAKCF